MLDERAAQRQDGERAGGQKMLLGAALVLAFMRDRRDDAALPGVPADDRDPGERAQRELRAVGRDDEPRADSRAVVSVSRAVDAPGSKSWTRRRRRISTPSVSRGVRQRGDEIVVERHMGERLVRRAASKRNCSSRTASRTPPS